MEDQERQDDPNIHLVHTRDIAERSDFDRDQVVKTKELGEDWGDGFFVEEEPVVVYRDAQGGIVKTVPLSEHAEQQAEMAEPIIAEQKIQPTPISRQDRDKLVAILAARLFKWYATQPRHPTKYNPVHDGIPDLPPGSPDNLQPLPGTKLYPATPGQVIDWLKTTVIGPRVQVQNHKRGLDGYQPQLTISRKAY